MAVPTLAADAPGATQPSPAPSGAAGTPGHAGPSADEVKEANNPLASVVAFNVQDYYASNSSELADTSANNFLLRLAVPFGPFLARATLPLVTTSSAGASASGLGDFNAFVTLRLSDAKSPTTVAVGPLYVAPTASEDSLGAGKHQLGGAVILLHSVGPLLAGTLLQYQHSFAGDASRGSTSVLTPQLFGILQAGGGLYFRSTPTAVFDLESGNYYVPIGIGVGHVSKVGSVVVNAFLEPQFSVLSHGPGQALFQIFSGINFQFHL